MTKLDSLRTVIPGCLVACAVWTMFRRRKGEGGEAMTQLSNVSTCVRWIRLCQALYNTFLRTARLMEKRTFGRRRVALTVRWRIVHKEEIHIWTVVFWVKTRSILIKSSSNKTSDSLLRHVGSNLGEDTEYSELFYSISSVAPGKFWDNTSVKTRLLPSTSYPIRQSIYSSKLRVRILRFWYSFGGTYQLLHDGWRVR